MPSLRSIFSLLALGSVMVENPMPQRILARAIRVVALVILGSMFLAAFILTLIACGYKLMVAHGVTEADAMLYVLGIVLVIVIAVIVTAVKATSHLMDEVKTSIKKPVPLPEHLGMQAGNVVDAFITGFLSRYHNRPEV